MKKLIPIGIFLAVLVVSGGLTMAKSEAKGTEMKKVIIGFHEKPSVAMVKQHGGQINHKLGFINAIAADVPEKAIGALKSNPRVKYVEKDQKVHILGETLPWGVDRIDAEVVWGGNDSAKEISTEVTGSGQQVAVVDTGIDYTHPDLDGNYVDGYDFVNGDDDPKDDNGHGTHVSGTVAAEENTEGVIGVAPETGIYALKALDKRGSGYLSDVAAGIEWAVEGPNGKEGDEDDAEVVSMSLGGDGSSTLKDAVDYAYNHGTLPVAAAGNDGDGDCSTAETSYPAAYGSVIAVGATDSSDSIASFSNSGDYLELAAPGVDIYSTMPTYHVHLNTGLYRYSQDYDTMSGTSMACPHVSGTAALVFAAGATDSDGDGNVADDVREIMNSTAGDLGYPSTCQGNGFVKANASVNSVDGDTAVTPSVNLTNPSEGEEISGETEIAADASDSDGSVSKVEFLVDGGSVGNDSDGSDGWNASWDSSTVSDGEHTITAEATDNGSLTSSDSITVTTENIDNAPTVSWVNPQDGNTVSGMVEVQIDATDDRNTGSDLSVQWEINDSGNWRTASYNETSGYYEDLWNSSKVSDGDYNLDAKASDSNGNTGSEKRITVSVSNQETTSGGMYVSDISWRETGPHLRSTVTVQYDSDGDGVAESSDDPVSDATVDYNLTNQDTDESRIYTGTTDSEGKVEFTWKKAPSGDYKGEVTDLTHSSYSWNSNLDVDNPDYY